MTNLKTIALSDDHQIQGEYVGTLPDGRVTVRIDKAKSIPCEWKASFLHNYCATCGRDEGEMAACPKAQTKDEFHTGKEI